jgi:hypothetical protein
MLKTEVSPQMYVGLIIAVSAINKLLRAKTNTALEDK